MLFFLRCVRLLDRFGDTEGKMMLVRCRHFCLVQLCHDGDPQGQNQIGTVMKRLAKNQYGFIPRTSHLKSPLYEYDGSKRIVKSVKYALAMEQSVRRHLPFIEGMRSSPPCPK